MAVDGWRSKEGPGTSPLLAVPNVTAHPSTASVLITVLPYDSPLLCGFNVANEGLREQESDWRRPGESGCIDAGECGTGPGPGPVNPTEHDRGRSPTLDLSCNLDISLK